VSSLPWSLSLFHEKWWNNGTVFYLVITLSVPSVKNPNQTSVFVQTNADGPAMRVSLGPFGSGIFERDIFETNQNG
jgi:hypothetical protein